MKTIEVCLSPELMHLYDVSDKTVVVVDILRATSCMVTAFAHGVDCIMPFPDLESCQAMKQKGYVTSGERNGEKVEGFDKGNSPFEYMEEIRGLKIAFTTTNGTQAINRSLGARELLVGAFLNLSVVAKHLINGSNNVLVVCAGWKGRVNLEDTLFAGALVSKVKGHIEADCDSALAAQHLYDIAKGDMVEFLKQASHIKRLNRLGIHEDIKFCLTEDKYNVVPKLKDGILGC
ncbi:MAG TPA: 2-phosphosulfolactate phosphatase [Cyclobacteriaceae bacterium]|nr:2-phosphosulfolactate phosphatase [Cyclobacteriaceae bacterium]